MPATVNGGGDQLARGAVRATFKPAEVTQERWNAIFGDDSGPKLKVSGSDSDSKKTGTARIKSGKNRKSVTR